MNFIVLIMKVEWNSDLSLHLTNQTSFILEVFDLKMMFPDFYFCDLSGLRHCEDKSETCAAVVGIAFVIFM